MENREKKTQAAQRERMGTGQTKPACYSPFFLCANGQTVKMKKKKIT